MTKDTRMIVVVDNSLTVQASPELYIEKAIKWGSHSVSAHFDFSKLPRPLHEIFLRVIKGMMPLVIAGSPELREATWITEKEDSSE